MPCDDWTHDHNDIPWPEAEGELTIHSCERTCDYCPPTKQRELYSASNLRKLVYGVHIDPAPKSKPASHPGVWITDYNGQIVREQRRVKKMRKRGKAHRQSSDVSSPRSVRPTKRARKSAPSAPASPAMRSNRTTALVTRIAGEDEEADDEGIEVYEANTTVANRYEGAGTAHEAGQNGQAVTVPTFIQAEALAGLEMLSDAAFEREFRMTEARLDESRLIQQRLRMEAERERRASLRYLRT